MNDHLYRGGQPSPDGFRELAADHVLTVIDLREAGEGTEAERRVVQGLNMRYLNVPLSGILAPSEDQMKRVLSLITPDDSGLTFVHCWRGKDRTGTVIACYRIQHDGWQPRRALVEAEKNGISRVQFRMRSFIMRYKPVDLPAPLMAAGK